MSIESTHQIVINGYTFIKTCLYSPEQYDVFNSGELVGYVRLRHGTLICDAINFNNKTVYTHTFEDPYKDCFDNDFERNTFLLKIAEALEKNENEEAAKQKPFDRFIINEDSKVLIVFFKDGSKQVVKCAEEDTFDVSVGAALALAKHFFGSGNNFRKEVEFRASRAKVIKANTPEPEAPKKAPSKKPSAKKSK